MTEKNNNKYSGVPPEQMFLVGGAVRDILLGLDPKDKDYVVIGHTEEDMFSYRFFKNGKVIKKDGKEIQFEKVGADFPVFLHPLTGEEYALARRERKTDAGYNGFSVETENVTLEDDLFRRDLTINAMAMDCNGNLIDPYNGKDDLNNKVLRHVSKHFAEDPVRILRIARFSARYDFSIAQDTKDMMSEMVRNGEFDSLTGERVWKEFEKVLTEKHLNNFFNNLEEIGALAKIPGFSEIKEKEFFDYIGSNSKNYFTISMLHTFSQMDKNDLAKWKMPSDERHKVNQFAVWKNHEGFYADLSYEERLSFIQLNRGLQHQDKASEIIEYVSFYKSWKEDQPFNIIKEQTAFKEDIAKLKELDYESIVQEAKELKAKPNELIKSYQLDVLKGKKKSLKL
jgi:tRNA nucleotidyltransferase/poly(A) polymerase